AVELGGDAGAVVVSRLQAVDVLDQVGAEQQRISGSHAGRHPGQEDSALVGGQIADRAPEEGDHPPTAGGDAVEVVLEVAHDGVDVHALVLGGDGGRGRPQRG